MTDKNPICEQIETFAQVCNISLSILGKRTGIQRQNIYNFLNSNGKGMSVERQAKMLDLLGIRSSKLRSDWLHRWYATPDLKNITRALNLMLPTSALQTTKIVRFYSGRLALEESAVLVIQHMQSVIFILIHRPMSIEPPLPVTPENLGFGVALKRLLPMTMAKYQAWVIGDESEKKILHELREFVLSEHAVEEEALIASMPEYEPEDEDDSSTQSESEYAFCKQVEDLTHSAKGRGLSESEILRRIKLALSI